MREIRKKAWILGLLGSVLGLAVALAFHYLSGMDSALSWDKNPLPLLLYFLLSAAYGAVNMGTSAVYGIEKWSILRCTFTHFLISMGSTFVFFGTMIGLGWMDMPPAGFCALAIAAFIAVYFTIWLAQYLSYRNQVKKMNAKLREWKARRPK